MTIVGWIVRVALGFFNFFRGLFGWIKDRRLVKLGELEEENEQLAEHVERVKRGRRARNDTDWLQSIRKRARRD